MKPEFKFSKIVKKRMAQAANAAYLGGLWHGKPYPHIFKELKSNFIDGDVPVFCNLRQTTGAKIHYHLGATHLNSSQVMCISFFKKFFDTPEREKMLLNIFRETLPLQEYKNLVPANTNIVKAFFEYEPDHKERTNFDFYLELSSGNHISIEVKFTESNFGRISSCKSDPHKYARKWNEIYVPLLNECTAASDKSLVCQNAHNPYECINRGELNNECQNCAHCFIHEFYAYYQIWRNVSYASSPSDIVFFLTPRENDALDNERRYIDVLGGHINGPIIRNIYWEDLVHSALEETKQDPEFYKYLVLFKDKYLPT